MSALLLALVTLIAANPSSKWIEVPSATDQNISATIELAGKTMHVELCCPATYLGYGLAIGSGTCAAPTAGASAIVVGHNDWRRNNGRLVATVPTVFPIRSAQPYHLFVVDQYSGHPNDALACGDVPADLTSR